jgi:hypothetical protein
MPGASYTGLLKNTDGRLVGKYAAERRLNQKNDTDTVENMGKLITG